VSDIRFRPLVIEAAVIQNPTSKTILGGILRVELPPL
jgi:hypothetical protein